MKTRKFVWLLAAVAAAGTLFGILPEWFPDAFVSSLAFPFSQIGALISFLAGTGALGNGAALLLLAMLSGLPLLFCLNDRVRQNKLLRGSCAALTVVFAVGYFALVRPDLFQNENLFALSSYQPIARAVTGGLMWSGIVAFATVFLVCLIREGDTPHLLGYGMGVLYAAGGVLAASAAVPVLSAITAAVRGGHPGDLTVNAVCAVLDVAPTVFMVLAICAAGKLLSAYRSEQTDDVLPLAERTSHLCLISLLLTAAVSLLTNFLPVVFGAYLDNTKVAVNIPLARLFIAVAMLLVTKLIERNRTLQQDNDLFI